MTVTAGDQVPIQRERHDEGDHQAETEAPPEERVAEACGQAPGTATMNALSTISIVVIEAVSDANASRDARCRGTPPRTIGPSVSA